MLIFTYTKPKILVSRCLEFDACRYDGQIIKNKFIDLLKPHVEFLTVCPEVDIGMGIPRPTIHLEKIDDVMTLYQTKTEKDYLPEMAKFAHTFASDHSDIEGVIFKAKSPSCGIKGITVYKNGNKTQEKASGVFAGIMLDKMPHIFAEDEGRLNNFNLREDYLTKIFTTSHFNAIAKDLTLKDLVEFQASYKYLFMCYNQHRLRELGRIVANHEKKELKDVFSNYRMKLFELLEKRRNKKNTINTLQHIMGYFSKELNSSEKSHFLQLIERYRNNEIPLFTINQMLISWVFRFNQTYLKNQRFFSAFPEVLMTGSQPEI